VQILSDRTLSKKTWATSVICPQANSAKNTILFYHIYSILSASPMMRLWMCFGPG